MYLQLLIKLYFFLDFYHYFMLNLQRYAAFADESSRVLKTESVCSKENNTALGRSLWQQLITTNNTFVCRVSYRGVGK